MQREAAAVIAEEQLEALAAGTLRLPHTEAIPLPAPVRCRGGCCEEWYCCASCADTAWQQYHQLLCCGPDEDDDTASGSAAACSSGKGKAPAAAGSDSQQEAQAQQREQREALREFLHHADSTNDVFRLAGIVVAMVLQAAQRQLEAQQQQQQQAGSGGGSSGGEPSSEACWAALLAAWQPFAGGHKGLWWECTAAPPEAAADMRQLAGDSLELLTAALPAALPAHFPALLSLPVWGSIIGKWLCWARPGGLGFPSAACSCSAADPRAPEWLPYGHCASRSMLGFLHF
jgi:hypothetical protein